MKAENSEMQTGGGPAGALPFIYGHVDPTLFPIERLKEASDQAFGQYGTQALNYGIERGCGRLLTYLRSKMTRDEGLDLSPRDIMLTVGASGGLDAVCRLCTQPGDTVLVEAPSYHEAVAVIKDYPIRFASVPVDEQGLVVEALEERLGDPAAKNARYRFLYTIPTFQNPSGVTLDTARRVALLELAHRHGF